MANRNGRKWIIAGAILLGLTVVSLAILQNAVRGNFAAKRPEAQAGGRAISRGAPGQKIAGRFYVEGAASPGAPLVVVLHGDAPFMKPSYHYSFASQLAQRLPGVPVAALLRPGFSDPFGGRSDGSRGSASGDDYTPGVTHNVANTIALLREEFAASDVVLVGHSGGAAISANIAAAAPGLVDSVILLSCPCDVPAFRMHMARKQFSPFWLWPSGSESPLTTVGKVAPATQIFAITGEHDSITPVAYARAYTQAAVGRGLSASLTILPGRDHEILLDDAVLEFTRQRVTELITPAPQPVAARFQ